MILTNSYYKKFLLLFFMFRGKCIKKYQEKQRVHDPVSEAENVDVSLSPEPISTPAKRTSTECGFNSVTPSKSSSLDSSLIVPKVCHFK